MLKNKSNNGAKLYMLCLGDGGHSLYFFKDGKSKIKLSGGFI